MSTNYYALMKAMKYVTPVYQTDNLEKFPDSDSKQLKFLHGLKLFNRGQKKTSKKIGYANIGKHIKNNLNQEKFKNCKI